MTSVTLFLMMVPLICQKKVDIDGHIGFSEHDTPRNHQIDDETKETHLVTCWLSVLRCLSHLWWDNMKLQQLVYRLCRQCLHPATELLFINET